MRVASVVPSLELLYTSEFELGAAVDAGLSARGLRRVVPIIGGRFEGPRLSGTVLPGGADWQVVRMDGVVEVEAHYVMQVESGAKFVVKNTGILKAPGAVLGALAVGDVPEPGSYYFRTRTFFEAGDEELAWLNRTIAIGVAEIGRDRVVVTVYRVK